LIELILPFSSPPTTTRLAGLFASAAAALV